MSQRRELLEEAWAGDIIGIPNHGTLRLGDTLTEGEALQFTGLPFFAPELFQAVEIADPLRSKQLRTGLMQLGEEGAIQVFRPHFSGSLLLGAVGTLQFDVVLHRLSGEYNVAARLAPTPYRVARWIHSDDERQLKRFIEENAHRIAYDVVDAPTILLTHAAELRVLQERWPDVSFHALREHAGRVFQTDMAA
jgi:peptide chain release factor 3